MRKHNDEKAALERAAMQQFLHIYNRNHTPLLSIWKRQERPDYVLKNAEHEYLGVEITHLFYNHIEARMLLGRQLERDQAGIGRFEAYIRVMNNLLKQKEEKLGGYNQPFPVSLLMRNASPGFGMSDMIRYRNMVYRPTGMQHVWFLSRERYQQEWLLTNLLEL